MPIQGMETVHLRLVGIMPKATAKAIKDLNCILLTKRKTMNLQTFQKTLEDLPFEQLPPLPDWQQDFVGISLEAALQLRPIPSILHYACWHSLATNRPVNLFLARHNKEDVVPLERSHPAFLLMRLAALETIPEKQMLDYKETWKIRHHLSRNATFHPAHPTWLQLIKATPRQRGQIVERTQTKIHVTMQQFRKNTVTANVHTLPTTADSIRSKFPTLDLPWIQSQRPVKMSKLPPWPRVLFNQILMLPEVTVYVLEQELFFQTGPGPLLMLCETEAAMLCAPQGTLRGNSPSTGTAQQASEASGLDIDNHWNVVVTSEENTTYYTFWKNHHQEALHIAQPLLQDGQLTYQPLYRVSKPSNTHD